MAPETRTAAHGRPQTDRAPLRAHPPDPAAPAARCPPFQVVSGEALRLPPVADLARSSAAKCREEEAIDLGTPSFGRLGVGSPRHPRLHSLLRARHALIRRTSWPAWPRRAPPARDNHRPATASPIRATHPRCSTPRASAWSRLAPSTSSRSPRCTRTPRSSAFLEPAPLDRGEAWRRSPLAPPRVLGTRIRVGSRERVRALRVRRVAGAHRHQPGASGQPPLAACGRTGRGEGRAGNGFARAPGASFSLAATLTLSRCRTRGIRLGSAPSHHADGPISRHPDSRSSGGSRAAACAHAGTTRSR